MIMNLTMMKRMTSHINNNNYTVKVIKTKDNIECSYCFFIRGRNKITVPNTIRTPTSVVYINANGSDFT